MSGKPSEALITFLQQIDFPMECLPLLKEAVLRSWQDSQRSILKASAYNNSIEQFVAVLEDIDANIN